MKRKRGRPRATKSANKLMAKVYLKCCICKKIREINTTRPETYTPKVRENFICLFCKD